VVEWDELMAKYRTRNGVGTRDQQEKEVALEAVN
jgi:hypothetical protein